MLAEANASAFAPQLPKLVEGKRRVRAQPTWVGNTLKAFCPRGIPGRPSVNDRSEIETLTDREQVP